MNPSDNIFQNKLDQANSSNIPEELLWDNMAPSLLPKLAAEKKKRRAAKWWKWGRGGLLALLILIGPCRALWVYTPLSNFDIVIAEIIEEKEAVEIPTPTTAPNPQNIEALQKASNEPTLSFSNQVVISERSQPTVIDTFKREEGKNEIISQKKSQVFKRIESLDIDIAELRYSRSVFWDEEITPPPTKPQFIRSRTSIKLYGGLNGFEADYASEVNSFEPFETNLTGYQFGIRYQKRFAQKYSYNLGIEYEHLSYRFDRTIEEGIQLYRPNTVDTIFVNRTTGDSTFVFRDSINGIRTTIARFYNNHQSFNLPLLLGYSFDQNKLGFEVFTGPNLKLLRTTSGLTATNNPEFIQLERTDEVYKTGLTLDWTLEGQINYRLSDRFSLNLNGGLEKSLSNWIKSEEFRFAKRPLIFDLNVGISFIL